MLKSFVRRIDNMAFSSDTKRRLEARSKEAPILDLSNISQRKQDEDVKLGFTDSNGNLMIPAHIVTTNQSTLLGVNDLGALQINPYSKDTPHLTSIGFDPLASQSPREKLKGGDAKVIVIDTEECRIIGINRPADGTKHPVQDASGVTFYKSNDGTTFIGLHISDGNTSVILDESDLTPDQKKRYITQKRHNGNELQVIGESEYYAIRGARTSAQTIEKGPSQTARFLVSHFSKEREKRGNETPKGGATLQAARIILPERNSKLHSTLEIACLGVDDSNSPTGKGDLGQAFLLGARIADRKKIALEGSPSFDLSHDPIRSRYGFESIAPMDTIDADGSVFMMTSDGITFSIASEAILLDLIRKNPEEIIKELSKKAQFEYLFGKSYDDGTCWLVIQKASNSSNQETTTKRRERRNLPEEIINVSTELNTLLGIGAKLIDSNFDELATEVLEIQNAMKQNTNEIADLRARSKLLSQTLENMINLQEKRKLSEQFLADPVIGECYEFALVHKICQSLISLPSEVNVSETGSKLLTMLTTKENKKITISEISLEERKIFKNIMDVMAESGLILFRGTKASELITKFEETGDMQLILQIRSLIKTLPSLNAVNSIVKAINEKAIPSTGNFDKVYSQLQKFVTENSKIISDTQELITLIKGN